MRKSITSLLAMSAMTEAFITTENTGFTRSYGGGNNIVKKIKLTKKQSKARNKNKKSKKSRKNNR